MQDISIKAPLWHRYSRKLIARIEKPLSVGTFTQERADGWKMRLVVGKAGSWAQGNAIHLYWLVDKEDGVVADVRYQAYGQSALIGAAEAACSVILRKNYDQARRVGWELLDRQLRDKEQQPAFPPEAHLHLLLLIEAIQGAAAQCTDLPLPIAYSAPPISVPIGEVVEGGVPGWYGFTLKEQLSIIEGVLDNDIRPYIALDAGGVVLLDLIEGKQLQIAYEGSCNSCYSSVGTTLSYIQQVLRAKVHPDIEVIPQF